MFRFRNYFFIHTIALLFFCCVSHSQSTIDPKELFVEAESYFLFEEYRDALPLYQRLLRIEPENYNVQYKIGICYLNDPYQYPKAISYIEEAVNHINPKYRLNSYKEKLAPPEAVYYLGRAYHLNNQFNEAISFYQQFLTTADPAEFDLEMVESDIDACQRAKEEYRNPVFFKPENLGSVINSRFEDVNPVLSGDGKVLAFTRKLQFYDGVFISYKNENGQWSPPENLTGDFGLDGNSYTTGISYFGDELFVYRSDDYDGNIYSSRRINNKWTPLVKLNENINTKYWESHASPSPDGQTLIFTSNRDGGYGGLDIYKSKRGTNGAWGPAKNMGPVINSPANEETPFLTDEGYTLFFSSQGHNTMGGYDIYASKLMSDGNWTRPLNMGYPLNNSKDNVFYSPIGAGAMGLYAYYEESTTKGMLDIYEIEIYNSLAARTFTIKGMIEGFSGNDGADKPRIMLYDKATNALVAEAEIAEDGTYSLNAAQGNYTLVVEGAGYETVKKEINLLVNQPDSLVELAAIALESTEKEVEPYIEQMPPVKQVVIAKRDFYAVSDSSSIPIELTLIKGSNLNVVATVNGNEIINDSIPDVKKRFTYFYKPKKGENILLFTAVDPEGNKSTTEVTVTYYEPPKEVEPPQLTEKSDSLISTQNAALQYLASDELGSYLEGLDLSQFDNAYLIYEHLLEQASEQNFSPEEVNLLFATYFTQKSKNVFLDQLGAESPDLLAALNSTPDSLTMPIQYLEYIGENKKVSPANLTEALWNLYSEELNRASEQYITLLSYTRENEVSSAPEGLESTDQVLNLLKQNYPKENISDLLKLAVTTESIEFFLQNLLVSSEDSLATFLIGLELEQEGLYNAIDLVEYLISQSSDSTYSLQSLFRALDKAHTNKNYNLMRFHQLLTQHAEGNLKSELLIMAENLDQYEDYESILRYLLVNSQHKNYSNENVYDLLVKLTGISDVEEFAEKFISYGFSEINNAIADTSLSHFSSPLELIQYLIAATQSYDFTASDINNLLIRMILERGLSEKGGGYYTDELEKTFWKSRRFITTVILVNIVLLLLIVLFTLRRRKEN